MTPPHTPFGDRPEDDDVLSDGSIPIDPVQQDRVRSLLAGLPDPGPMPEDLVARINARLADEVVQRGAGQGEVVDLASRRRRMRRMTGLAAVGTAAAAAGTVGVLLTSGVVTVPSGSALAFLGAGAQPSAAPTLQARISDGRVSSGSLDGEVASMLDQRFDPAFPTQAESPTVGPVATPRGLGDCLSSLGIGGYARAAAELTTYEAKPAVLVGVVTASGEKQAWVLDRQCRQIAAHHTLR